MSEQEVEVDLLDLVGVSVSKIVKIVNADVFFHLLRKYNVLLLKVFEIVVMRKKVM